MYQLHTEQIILELSTGQLAQVINPVWPGHPYLRLGGEKTEEVAVAVSAAAGRLCCCVLVFFFGNCETKKCILYRFYGAWLAETKKARDGQGIY
jgi:hypothetical protein